MKVGITSLRRYCRAAHQCITKENRQRSLLERCCQAGKCCISESDEHCWPQSAGNEQQNPHKRQRNRRFHQSKKEEPGYKHVVGPATATSVKKDEPGHQGY